MHLLGRGSLIYEKQQLKEIALIEENTEALCTTQEMCALEDIDPNFKRTKKWSFIGETHLPHPSKTSLPH